MPRTTMVALGPCNLARFCFRRTLQKPVSAGLLLVKAPLLTGALPPSVFKASMGSASGDSEDPPPALVLCGPSGAGKSTLMKLLTSEFR